MLEGVTGGRPAFLYSYDVHTVWLNREAMDALGVTRDVERLPWGTVEHDTETGDPTGYVHDFAVLGISEEGQRALEPFVPGYAPETQYLRLVESLDMATAFGITTIVEPQNGLDDLALFERARDEGTLRSRLVAALLCLPGTTSSRLDELDGARRRLDDDRLRVQAIKLYIDDVIEPHTAAMLAPYADAPDETGDTFWEPDEFAAFLIELERRGWQAFTHATGDRGVRTVLDAVARARGVRDRATRGTRSSTRSASIATTCRGSASSGSWRACNLVTARRTSSRSGAGASDRHGSGTPGRSARSPRRAVSSRSARTGTSRRWIRCTGCTRPSRERRPTARVAGTSARPWTSTRPSLRRRPAGPTRSVRKPTEALIRPGALADVVVLSRDLHAVQDPREVLDTRVTATVVGGEVVNRAP